MMTLRKRLDQLERKIKGRPRYVSLGDMTVEQRQAHFAGQTVEDMSDDELVFLGTGLSPPQWQALSTGEQDALLEAVIARGGETHDDPKALGTAGTCHRHAFAQGTL